MPPAVFHIEYHNPAFGHPPPSTRKSSTALHAMAPPLPESNKAAADGRVWKDTVLLGVPEISNNLRQPSCGSSSQASVLEVYNCKTNVVGGLKIELKSTSRCQATSSWRQRGVAILWPQDCRQKFSKAFFKWGR